MEPMVLRLLHEGPAPPRLILEPEAAWSETRALAVYERRGTGQLACEGAETLKVDDGRNLLITLGGPEMIVRR